MKNEKKAYTCLNCGAFSVKWQGQCPDCAAWNSLNETVAAKKNHSSLKALELKRLNEINEKLIIRYNSGFDEFDRVLGGGLVPGSVILVGGDPGIGKSTLLQQIASNLPLDLTACYVTGEESINQVAQRSSRIGTSHSSVLVIASTSLEQILHQIKKSE